jgi:hypothetical protein
MKKFIQTLVSINTWLWVRLAQLVHICKVDNIPANSGTTFQTYTIKAGKHKCQEAYFKPIRVRDMYFVAKFDESAIYTSKTAENQYDINKLWGVSDGLNHMKNSARIGWNYVDGEIRLHAFAHVNGEMKYQEITTVKPGQEVPCKISIHGDFYIFTANGNIVSIPRKTKTTLVDGYQLFPYFGGNETTLHKITIQIK